MKKTLLKIAPVAMLALAACNNSETPADGEEAETEETAKAAEEIELPPAIVKSDAYRCGNGTILHVDFFGREGAEGKKLAASIHVGDKSSPAIRVEAPKPAAAAEIALEGEAEDGASEAAVDPDGPMTSADGQASLAGDGAAITVTLPEIGSQSCKA